MQRLSTQLEVQTWNMPDGGWNEKMEVNGGDDVDEDHGNDKVDGQMGWLEGAEELVGDDSGWLKCKC